MDRGEYLKMLLDFKEKLMTKVAIDKMVLFGSRARGDFGRNSDFDLIVISDDFEGEKSFRRAIGFREYWDIDSPVDFVCLTNDEFNAKKNEIGIISEALKEGMEI